MSRAPLSPPVTGRRLLIDPTLPDPEPVRRGLIEAAGELACEQGLSSLHWLFPDATDTDSLESAGYLLRLGCQYHWTQPGYRDFDDFLDTLSTDHDGHAHIKTFDAVLAV